MQIDTKDSTHRLHLKDGPAQGYYFTGRAPILLRATIDPEGVGDVLQMFSDIPEPEEQVYVYRRVGSEGDVRVCFFPDPRVKSGRYVEWEYEYMPEVDGEKLRDNLTWQRWVFTRPGSEGAAG